MIEKYSIEKGGFDNVAKCVYNVPAVFDIAKVYKRLIVAVAERRGISPVTALAGVYSSWMSGKIDDYNSSMYYETWQSLSIRSR